MPTLTIPCTPCYQDWISCGNETLLVEAILAPDTAYIWYIENKGAVYSGEATTNADGMFTITVADLLDALLNPYASKFTLTVKANDAYQCSTVTWNDSAYCDSYSCIEFEVRNGDAVKNTLGCPCELMFELDNEPEV